jgi:archaellum biogenesis ATPase FlaH
MRLLKYEENEDLSITEFDEDTKPPYAILSHRWGAEADEVTFEDVVGNAGKNKPGYAKIRFCGEQAQRDGLQYFWVDTCCINKANKAELSLAIQSMFRWYRNSARCYVYLSDVSSRPLDTTPACNPQASELQRTDQFTWIWILLFIHPMFRWYHVMLQRFFVLLNVSGPQAYESKVEKSEWFTRGWTLQELLAPSSVEFFSREWEKLGDRVSLKSVIHEVTTIPPEVLEGAPISQFSVDARLRWRQTRDTKVEEDAAYSLSGIFNVDMAPVYGEGIESAFRRLYEKIWQQEEYLRKCEECVLDLCGTDPRNDKKRIQDTKGGLLKDSYRWVLHNDSFRQWHEDPQSRLLWIKGDPGKGKTMLLCGIIDELQASSAIAKTNTVSYFFCQATDVRINSATAVLRGLLYMLVKQQPSLASHVRKKYDDTGKNMFEDANAWIPLVDIFTDVLLDPSLTTTYLVVDALDECVTNLPKLLNFVAKQSSASSRIKWIVSSRNWPEIERRLEQADHKVRLSLELNAASVSTAVQAYIEQKASELAQQNKYDERTKRAVLEHLTSNANDTFLWVALVCQHLQATARRNVLMKLELFPPGLDALYERMMQQISKTDDARLCKQVLAAVALVYRPIALKELVTLVEPLESIADDSELQEIISLCGSFLTLREQTVYFVHQSAKDFLLAKAAQDIFPAGQEAVHQVIFARSLQIMSTALRRDMYGLKALGTPIDDVVVPTPDPLAALRYSCVHWVDHLCASNTTSSATYAECLRDRGVVDRFLREKCLYWLESLSLCKSMSKGVVSVRELQTLVQVCLRQATPLDVLFTDCS